MPVVKQDSPPIVDGIEITTAGRLPKIVRVKAEYYDTVSDPEQFLTSLRRAGVNANLFSFLQAPWESQPKFPYHVEFDSIAVLPITTYQHWWTKQISDKIRNMARRAQKKGVDVRIVPFDDSLVTGIKKIYDESPIRQGRKFIHYGKSLEQVRKDHITYLSQSEFIGAYLGEELIGFIKLVHSAGMSHLMQIISFMSHREKAPIDALLAKAVETCAEKGVTQLQYGSWSRGGLGEYKIHRGFKKIEVPRYFVPLDAVGRMALACRGHRPARNYIPVGMMDWLTDKRNRWNAARHKAG